MADMMIDAESLRRLGYDMARAGTALSVEVPGELARNARGLATAAQTHVRNYQRTGQDPSQGAAEAVAESIRPEPAGHNSFRVRAGGSDIPLAGLWELGNKGAGENAPTFRHPTFGNKQSWQVQAKWPYFRMAMKEYEPIILYRFSALVSNTLHRFRL